ncbi:MAG: porphobilinogen deaminase [Euryarchaeota archaeon ADurb.BinA087]|nr:MAG: porphobilinogen deaminase [Euryarchaeota archaeon ADurb.BinA087]
MPVRIGTRGSRLALAQAERVASLLRDCGTASEIVITTTKGDTVDGVPLHEIGGQGVFVRALDDAIIDGTIDAAVHSMKDIPAKRPDGLRTCAILKRDSPADFLVHTIPREEIRVIGTTSTRRRAQLLRHMEGILVKQLRGNVDTRLRKLTEGQYDAIVLAEAGLERMGLSVSGTRLSPQRFVPSPNQGTIAVVCRDDPPLCEVFAPLDHDQTRIDVEMERTVMEEVGGGCFTPQGIYAHHGHLIGEILSLDGTRRIRREDDVCSLEDARIFGQYLRKEGEELIREAYEKLRICDEG